MQSLFWRHLTIVEASRVVELRRNIVYGPEFTDLFRSAGEHVDKILKGARHSDLPVLQPAKFDLVINLKAAKALGITYLTRSSFRQLN